MSDDRLPPWEAIHPALTEDRLVTVGQIIKKFRNAKLKKRLPPDNNWNIGCDCFAWVSWGIRRAAEGEHRDWLFVPVRESELDFLFLIGGRSGVPLKIYREDAQGQPGRTLRVNESESRVRQTVFPFHPPDTVLRFAVETDSDGAVRNVALVQLDPEGGVCYEWPIPLEYSVEVVDLFQTEGVELPEPAVDLREAERAKTEEEGRKETGA